MAKKSFHLSFLSGLAVWLLLVYISLDYSLFWFILILNIMENEIECRWCVTIFLHFELIGDRNDPCGHDLDSDALFEHFQLFASISFNWFLGYFNLFCLIQPFFRFGFFYLLLDFLGLAILFDVMYQRFVGFSLCSFFLLLIVPKGHCFLWFLLIWLFLRAT